VVEEDSGEGSGGGSVPWGEQEGKTAEDNGARFGFVATHGCRREG
jgi:hypothetical protein